MFDGGFTPTLAGAEAELSIGNITGSRFREGIFEDKTFIATMRALIAPRIKETHNTCVLYHYCARFDDALFRSKDELRIALNQYDFYSDSLTIVDMSSLIPEFRNLAFSSIQNQLQSIWPGFVELKDLEEFASKLGKILFYTNEAAKSSVVFVEKVDFRVWHFLQSLTSRLLPWFFEDEPLNDKERELLKSLTKNTPDEYLRLIEEFAKEYDFRIAKLERLLTGFNKKAKEFLLSDVEAKLENIESDIQVNINHYRNLLKNREQKIIEQQGLKAQIKEAGQSSEVLDYFKVNKNLYLVNTYQDSIEFIVSCYLENFDCDMYERYSSNFESYMYDETEYTVTNPEFTDFESRKRLLDAIFSDEPLLKLKTCAYYNISMQGWVDTERYYDFPQTYDDRIPNPHLQHHSCLGDQKPLIEEALRGGDIVGAIEQCICSARSINIGEGVTAKYLLAGLFSAEANKFVELPDGTSCTPSEALHWLENYNKKHGGV